MKNEKKTPAQVAAAKNLELNDADVDPRQLNREIKRSLSRHPMNVDELAESLRISATKVRYAITEMRQSGVNFRQLPNAKLFLTNVVDTGGKLVLTADKNERWTTFGIITDNHKGNRHHRQDVEDLAYDKFEEDGIKVVLNAGNMIDGEARFNKSELVVHGMDAQIDIWIDTTPQKKGITTYFVTGDDHEGWYAQRECINIGQYMQMKAEKAGRSDLRFLGHVEADIELRCGKGSSPMKLMHPGGGSSYAFSYAPQKIVESFQGGEKPSVLVIGHYHKYDVCFPREVHVISAGCCQDQTMFMRKNKIAAHVGFVKVGIQQDSTDGHIIGLRHEWRNFYDRGYYEKRY